MLFNLDSMWWQVFKDLFLSGSVMYVIFIVYFNFFYFMKDLRIYLSGTKRSGKMDKLKSFIEKHTKKKKERALSKNKILRSVQKKERKLFRKGRFSLKKKLNLYLTVVIVGLGLTTVLQNVFLLNVTWLMIIIAGSLLLVKRFDKKAHSKFDLAMSILLIFGLALLYFVIFFDVLVRELPRVKYGIVFLEIYIIVYILILIYDILKKSNANKIWKFVSFMFVFIVFTYWNFLFFGFYFLCEDDKIFIDTSPSTYTQQGIEIREFFEMANNSAFYGVERTVHGMDFEVTSAQGRPTILVPGTSERISNNEIVMYLVLYLYLFVSPAISLGLAVDLLEVADTRKSRRTRKPKAKKKENITTARRVHRYDVEKRRMRMQK